VLAYIRFHTSYRSFRHRRILPQVLDIHNLVTDPADSSLSIPVIGHWPLVFSGLFARLKQGGVQGDRHGRHQCGFTEIACFRRMSCWATCTLCCGNCTDVLAGLVASGKRQLSFADESNECSSTAGCSRGGVCQIYAKTSEVMLAFKQIRGFPTTRHGYKQMLLWMRSFGEVVRVGVECTGSYGAGLLRFLQQAHVTVLEVTAPDRSDRRKRGKDDTLDAYNAAHAAFAGVRTVSEGHSKLEAIRCLKRYIAREVFYVIQQRCQCRP
jgi:hypothetical protein